MVIYINISICYLVERLEKMFKFDFCFGMIFNYLHKYFTINFALFLQLILLNSVV